MPFGILRTYKKTNNLKKVKKFRDEYEFWDFFYDHKNKESPFIYQESDLFNFVEKYKLDPAETDKFPRPKEWAFEFQIKCASLEILPFEESHKITLSRIIKEKIKKNYDRFEVWRKR